LNGLLPELEYAGTREFDFNTELFPELETSRGTTRAPLQKTKAMPPQSLAIPRAAAPLASACLIRSDSEVLDFFHFNSSALRPFHIREIRDIAARIASSFSSPSPIRDVMIVGHTDARGTDQFNFDLADKRARAVALRLLQELGANASKVFIASGSRGAGSPIAPNSFDRGRACNRRVEIFFGCRTDACQGRSFRDFFTEYDLRTFPAPPDRPFGLSVNPNLTPAQKTQRAKDVIAVVGVLQARLANRAAVARNLPATISIPAVDLDAVKRLSDLQIQLFFESFPAPGNTLDLAAFRRAFYDFANGDLRTPEIGPNKGVGEPDSFALFLFAEFAFLCIEKSIRAPLWTELLPWFVSAQEIFMHVYRRKPHPAPPPVGAPLPPACATPRQPRNSYAFANFEGSGKSNEQRKTDLFRKYSGMNLNQLIVAAKENLLRAQCMP